MIYLGYPDLRDRAAALLDSLARNRPLVDVSLWQRATDTHAVFDTRPDIAEAVADIYRDALKRPTGGPRTMAQFLVGGMDAMTALVKAAASAT